MSGEMFDRLQRFKKDSGCDPSPGCTRGIHCLTFEKRAICHCEKANGRRSNPHNYSIKDEIASSLCSSQ